jgi:glycosyltransferase involved in cell wall biosynthesis
VGHRVWWKDELAKAYEQMHYKEDVLFLGRAEPDTLARLLGSATALVYPSLYEGFGIPILEAFEAEVPVITSNCTSMPEVAGDAALLIEPTNVEALADALTQMSNNLTLRNQLITKGRLQRTHFSWDITAEKLWQSMVKTIE